jgi:transposase
MDNVGMDLGKKESQIAIITDAGELIEKRIRTERERLIEFFKERPHARILMESSTISEWVARLLEELGHEVIVADPNYAPMYAQRSRRVKTDKRDARARASFVTWVQATLSRERLEVATGSSKCFGVRVEKLELPEHLRIEITPLLAALDPINARIEELDERMGEHARQDERAKRLMTVPQIGTLTAVAFVATLDDAGRFGSAHQVEAYLGLVPREWSSSEAQRRGHITKAGHSRMRWLLVEAAWRLATHHKRPETQALTAWADRIARRRGKRIAMVALARKLTGVLYAISRDGSVYDPSKLGGMEVAKAEHAA